MAGNVASRALRVLATAAAVLAVLVFWVQRYRVLLLFGWRYTDEDQALLAYIVREVQAGAVKAPTFYGQSYGNWIESAVAALFTPASVSPLFTLPIATQFLCWLPFGLLGYVEWRAGRRLVASVMLWLPCLMPNRADLLYSMPRAWMPGISLAMIGAVLLRTRPLALGALMVCAVTLNSAAGLLALPVLIEAVLRERRNFRFLGRLGGGLVLGGLHPLALRLFDATHPGWSIHPSPTWAWSPTRLLEGVSTVGSPLGALLVPTVLLVALALVVGRLRGPALAALIAAVVATVLSFGLEKVWDGRPSVFFPHERAYLALPFVGAWLLWLSLGRPRWAFPVTRRTMTGGGAVFLVMVTGLVSRETRRPALVAAEMKQSTPSVVNPRAIADLLPLCAVTGDQARREGRLWVVFRDDRAAAYACAAEFYGQADTLYWHYERRQWLLARFRPEQSLWYPAFP